jgi:hypothetical protein
MKYLLCILLLTGCTTSVTKQNSGVEKLTDKIEAVKVELSNKITSQNAQIQASLEKTIAAQEDLILKAANSNWYTISSIQLVTLSERERAVLNGHAYSTQAYLGTPELSVIKAAEAVNKRLLDEQLTTIEQLKSELATKNAEAEQLSKSVEAQKLASTELNKKLHETIQSSQTEIIALQDERANLFQKLNNSLAQLLRDSESKKELAKYVLRITSIISGVLVIAAIVGLYFFKSPRFAAYCVGGSALIFGFGWFFVQIPPWLIISSFIFVVTVVPLVLIHGYRQGRKVMAQELTS